MSQSLVEDAPAARKAADHDDLIATLRDDEDRLDTTTMAPAGVAAIVAAAIASVAAIVARVQRQPVSIVRRGSGKSPSDAGPRHHHAKTRACAKGKTPPDTSDGRDGEGWARLLTSTAFASQHLHRELGPTWTAVLFEACCVRSDDDAWRNVRGAMCMRMSITDAVRSVPLVLWSIARGCDKGRALIAAARGGRLDVLQHLCECGCAWNEDACYWAARYGHLDVLEWARDEMGGSWDEMTSYSAAAGGHLNVLKHLHENGCPWNEATCEYAAEGGHLDVLKYARDNGCPWNERTCLGAAWGGHLDVHRVGRKDADALVLANAEAAGEVARGGVLQQIVQPLVVHLEIRETELKRMLSLRASNRLEQCLDCQHHHSRTTGSAAEHRVGLRGDGERGRV